MRLLSLALALLICGALCLDAVGRCSPPVLSARDLIATEFTWCTVGDPGNKAFPGWGGQFVDRGSVPYVYQITQTELLTRQYLEFVEAYWPYFDGDPTSESLTGAWIVGHRTGNSYTFEIRPGWEDAPTTITLRNAARYCNWLHNGKARGEWAFLGGAYDATTFTRNEDRTYNDDYTRLPGARYFIPNVDEWLKAVYYDPNYSGMGEGGWWLYPAQSDDSLVLGYPENGGETNASLWDWYSSYLPAGMYPNVQTPWGLLDASGGVVELTESGYAFGSSFFDDDVFISFLDHIGYYHHFAHDDPNSTWLAQGFRIGRMVRR